MFLPPSNADRTLHPQHFSRFCRFRRSKLTPCGRPSQKLLLVVIPLRYAGTSMNVRSLTTIITVVVACNAANLQAQSCGKAPKGVAVIASTSVCGNKPAVVLTGAWRSIFSAAFRWNNNGELEDRSPYALTDGSAASSPYKTQRKLQGISGDVLCYGNFYKDRKFPLPVQLTIKRTATSSLTRFCVKFTR